MRISRQQFLINQPSFPEETSTDAYYLEVANKLLSQAESCGAWKSWPEEVLRGASLIAVGYFQDVVADAGIWRGFINECRRLYGRTLPFFDTDDSYVDYELNKQDVRFITWYCLAMLYEPTRMLCPQDSRVTEIATEWFEILESAYDDAPIPEDFHLTHELEVHDPEEKERIARLANWLYLHCWLTRPANSLTMASLAAGLPEGEAGVKELRNRILRGMNELPTGPLALYLREWLWLVCEDRMPPVSRSQRREESVKENHPYYGLIMSAEGGREIMYFRDYGELNSFLIRALGWSPDEEHLPGLKQSEYFALYVNKERGLLIGQDVARGISDPENPYYDSEYAKEHAFDFLTVRGRCPADLVKYSMRKGWLPDASFPGFPESTGLVRENWDFICRCYLQQYYRD